MVKFVLTALAGFALVASMATPTHSAAPAPVPCFTHCKNLVCQTYPNPPFKKRCVQCLPTSGVSGFETCTPGGFIGVCPQNCTFTGSCVCV